MTKELSILVLDDNPSSAVAVMLDLFPEAINNGTFDSLPNIPKSLSTESIVKSTFIDVEILIQPDLNSLQDSISHINSTNFEIGEWDVILVDNHWGESDPAGGLQQLMPLLAAQSLKSKSNTQLALWTQHWGNPEIRDLYLTLMPKFSRKISNIRGLGKEDLTTLKEILQKSLIEKSETDSTPLNSLHDRSYSITDDKLPIKLKHFVDPIVHDYLIKDEEAKGKPPILLLSGEAGTGKSHFVKHNLRKNLAAALNTDLVPYSEVNCAKFIDTLGNSESELFGLCKGRFTGAIAQKGQVAQANGGILFFDEVGMLPIEMQGKLLSFLADGSYYSDGDSNRSERRQANCAIIFATNENLLELAEKEKMRWDFIDRISQFEYEIKPLRDRPNEIPDLALSIHKFENGSGLIDSDAIRFLINQDLPKNVRSLQYTVSEAILNHGRIAQEQLSLEMVEEAYFAKHPKQAAIKPTGNNTISIDNIHAEREFTDSEAILNQLESILMNNFSSGKAPKGVDVCKYWPRKSGGHGVTSQMFGRVLKDARSKIETRLNSEPEINWPLSRQFLGSKWKL